MNRLRSRNLVRQGGCSWQRELYGTGRSKELYHRKSDSVLHIAGRSDHQAGRGIVNSRTPGGIYLERRDADSR